MRTTLIIAAGGSGERFRKGLGNSPRSFPSKLFYPVSGQPLLVHTLRAFRKVKSIREIVLSVPRGVESAVKKILKNEVAVSCKIVPGGKTRAESVWKALEKSQPGNSWVMVHDGARPLVSQESIDELLASAKHTDAAILAQKVVPTIKEIGENNWVNRTIDRSRLAEAETPQLVRRNLLMKAYRENPHAMQATDEAALVESIGGRVKLVTHDGWNPKVTTVQDFDLLEAYLTRHQKSETRTGFGRDTHRLTAGRKFYLGGIRISSAKGPLGHSDGDALLHAVCDAILGVIGEGDIGDWFSDKNKKFKGIRSEVMLQKILKRAQEKKWVIKHLDTITVLESPKLGPHKKRIQKRIAKILGLPEDAVSIKAKTAEGLGPEGKGLAITCEAIATMERSTP
ncbi:MAG: 2-C-methyl-D-erythritol 4-phosphate cytidylyltransferase [Candidatus Omnitrophica bacterium]|nr:2-C-methyl-D-erythritol 4-phosphate cytidylyltransferase [Candidatus Omnitrophota bacterium]